MEYLFHYIIIILNKYSFSFQYHKQSVSVASTGSTNSFLLATTTPGRFML
jgi:hypothetical protein